MQICINILALRIAIFHSFLNQYFRHWREGNWSLKEPKNFKGLFLKDMTCSDKEFSFTCKDFRPQGVASNLD